MSFRHSGLYYLRLWICKLVAFFFVYHPAISIEPSTQKNQHGFRILRENGENDAIFNQIESDPYLQNYFRLKRRSIVFYT